MNSFVGFNYWVPWVGSPTLAGTPSLRAVRHARGAQGQGIAVRARYSGDGVAAGAIVKSDSDYRCRGRVIHFDKYGAQKVEIERLGVTNELVDASSAALGSAYARNEQRRNDN